MGLLAARQNIHMDYGILGSSDLDQASPLAASLQTNLLLPLIYPVVRDGKFKAKFLQKRLDKRARESGDYVKAFLKMFGKARPYVTMQSCKNQFYSDLITPLPDKIHIPGTEIHIFYALKMGKNTVPGISSILYIRFFMSRTCSTRSCWPATRNSGRIW